MPRGDFQRLVYCLMKTPLKQNPTLPTNNDLSHLADADYCKDELGLKIGFNHPLSLISRERLEQYGSPRYYEKRCGKWYICSLMVEEVPP